LQGLIRYELENSNDLPPSWSTERQIVLHFGELKTSLTWYNGSNRRSVRDLWPPKKEVGYDEYDGNNQQGVDPITGFWET
jgi:hypothetical protein